MITEKKYPKIMRKQQNALHLYFTHLSEELNMSGLDMKKTLKPGIDIWWTQKTVKEYLFRPIMKAQLLKDSTTELTTKEVDEVIKTISKHLGERFGIEVDFPSIETIIKNERLNDDKRK